MSVEYGEKVGRYKARKLMEKADVQVKKKKRLKGSKGIHKLPVAENILNRDFKPEQVNNVQIKQLI